MSEKLKGCSLIFILKASNADISNYQKEEGPSMSTPLLIESMEKLLVLHNQLHETVVEKTEAIKNNDMQILTRLLREEQKHVTAIQIADQKRQQATAHVMNNQTETTLSEVIKITSGLERDQLVILQEKLTNVLAELKDANALNQQLLEYSLQFVNLNLDLLAPELELANYSKTPNEGFEQPGGGRSIFDSKA